MTMERIRSCQMRHFVLKADNVGLGTLIDENIKVKPGT